MKKLMLFVFVFISILFYHSPASAQGVGINTSGNTPDPSAALDIDFTDRGTLLTRLTTAQRDLIPSPAKGLIIYNLDCDNFNYNAGTPSSPNWLPVNPSVVASPSSPGPVTGLSAVCANQTGVTYSIASVQGATSYQWTLPSGASVTSGDGTTDIIVSYGTSSGSVCVMASNLCGTSSQSCINPVTVAMPPPAPATSPANWISQAVFNANWSAAGGADGYYLDVATDNAFSNLVSGYNNLNIGNVLTYQITGLACATTYYYRVRAFNNCGPGQNSGVVTVVTTDCFSCGSTLTDSRDGKTYGTILKGSLCWMGSNLNYGTQITYTVAGQTAGGIQKYCYANNASNCTTYGGMYEWSEVMNGSVTCNGTGGTFPMCPTPVQGICPASWHVPSHYEWTLLEKSVGSNPGAFPYDGTTQGWLGTDEGTNLKTGGSSGFNVMMAGRGWNGNFDSLNSGALFWTSTDYNEGGAWSRHYDSGNGQSLRLVDDKGFGYAMSLRCIKD